MKIKKLIQKAKKHDSEAQYRLAQKYLNADGIRKNISKAVNWFELAAENGHTKAAMRLGELLWFGCGKIKPDDNRALTLFKQAAKGGLTKSQYLLGAILATDKVHYNPKEAFMWYKMAAESGDSEALHNVGVMYQLGEGVEKNTQLGAELIQQAAKEQEI